MRRLFLTPYLLLAGSLFAQDPMAKGMPAAEAAGNMKVQEGFSVDLIAAEPDIVQPIAMCFDARGRIWLAEGMTYPTRAPEGEGKDRILILEDADGDGSYETRKVFAEGLNLVSGIETGFGGLYVGAAPYFMFLADADGDDRADGEPKILLDGWGYQDTHETLNSFIWGPDGWLYGCHGVFTHSKVGKPGTPDDQRVPINAGIWRFHPVTEKFEVFAWGTSNPWGLDFNDRGEAFCEACVIPHLWHIIPGGYYQRQAGSHFNPHIYDPIGTIADHRHWVGNIREHAHWGHENGISKSVSDAGGGHAHCGFAISLSDSFPEEFRDSAMFFNIHGHRMNRDKLIPKGSGFVGKHAPDILLSMDEWFLGVAIEPGPDGALYFTDWHDDTSCHRPNPERWDRSNGRIFRLRHGESKPWKGDLTKLSDLELAKLQAGRSEWQLRTARRILQERVAGGAALDPSAIDFLTKTLNSNPDETRRLRAMWCLAVCGKFEAGLFQDASEAIRAWSVRLDPEGSLSTAAEEDSPIVQLSMCSALQKLPDESAWKMAEAIVSKLDPNDANLTKMFWFGFERIVPQDEARAIRMAASCPDHRLLKWTARRLSSSDSLLAVYSNGRLGKVDLLDSLRVRLEVSPDEGISDKGREILNTLKSDNQLDIRVKTDDLLTRVGDSEATGTLWKTLEDRGIAPPRRKKALGLLRHHLQPTDQGRLAGLMDDPALRLPVLLAWPALLDDAATKDRVAGFTEEEKLEVSRLAAREGKAALLLEWLGAKKLIKSDVPADAVARMREILDPSLQEAIVELWGELSADQAARLASIGEWRGKLTPPIMERANLKNGRILFDRTCASCHKLFGAGGEIGPELTGGERGSIDHWLDNILDPNALIGVGYELHQIEKNDGTIVVGMLAEENDDELILRMVGDETRILKKDVKSNTSLGKSMMPEGMINGMSDEEVRDLIGYLMSPVQVK